MNEKPRVKIENWSCTFIRCAFIFLGQREGGQIYPSQMCLQGNVYGHPRLNDGDFAVTGSVRNINGREVETNRTIYILGTPDPEFIEWCKQIGCHVPTDDEPIKTVNSSMDVVKGSSDQKPGNLD